MISSLQDLALPSQFHHQRTFCETRAMVRKCQRCAQCLRYGQLRVPVSIMTCTCKRIQDFSIVVNCVKILLLHVIYDQLIERLCCLQKPHVRQLSAGVVVYRVPSCSLPGNTCEILVFVYLSHNKSTVITSQLRQYR